MDLDEGAGSVFWLAWGLGVLHGRIGSSGWMEKWAHAKARSREVMTGCPWAVDSSWTEAWVLLNTKESLPIAVRLIDQHGLETVVR